MEQLRTALEKTPTYRHLEGIAIARIEPELLRTKLRYLRHVPFFKKFVPFFEKKVFSLSFFVFLLIIFNFTSDMSQASTRKKRTNLTYADKAAIIENFEMPKPTLSKDQVVDKYKIHITTLNKILQDKETITKTAATISGSRNAARSGEFPELEKGLYEWFLSARAKNLPVTGELLQTKAKQFALAADIPADKFHASNGWLSNFKSRFSITGRKLVGESGSTKIEDVEKGWKMVSDALEEYGEENCFNADETGLYFRMTPEYSLVCEKEPSHGTKQSKERITILVCSNASGSRKLPLVAIGKSANPRGMPKTLPLTYRSNKKAWMTSVIFEEFVKEFDSKMSAPTALLLDNASVHGISDNLALAHTTIIFLPPNTTSRTQPMDAGIIQTMKLRYRKAMINKVRKN
jgi:hypothetical protein